MTLTEAQKKLQEIEEARPQAYTSSYRDEMASLSDQLRNRKFNWNQNADALYKQYADRYIQQGKLAMKDSMGQTAALTGGYGNSYGSAVGQQTYDAICRRSLTRVSAYTTVHTRGIRTREMPLLMSTEG